MFENALIIVTGFPHQLKEFGWVDPDLLEKGAIAAAAIHQLRWHFPA